MQDEPQITAAEPSVEPLQSDAQAPANATVGLTESVEPLNKRQKIVNSLKKYVTKKRLIIAGIVVVALFIAGVAYTIFTDESGTGQAFDWNTGSLVDNGDQKTDMPGGWHFLDLTDTAEDESTFGVWLPDGDPDLGTRVIKAGEEGDDVKAIQGAINELAGSEVVTVNSTYDDSTQANVVELKIQYGLDEDKNVGKDFLRALFVDLADNTN